MQVEAGEILGIYTTDEVIMTYEWLQLNCMNYWKEGRQQ